MLQLDVRVLFTEGRALATQQMPRAAWPTSSGHRRLTSWKRSNINTSPASSPRDVEKNDTDPRVCLCRWMCEIFQGARNMKRYLDYYVNRRVMGPGQQRTPPYYYCTAVWNRGSFLVLATSRGKNTDPRNVARHSLAKKRVQFLKFLHRHTGPLFSPRTTTPPPPPIAAKVT